MKILPIASIFVLLTVAVCFAAEVTPVTDIVSKFYTVSTTYGSALEKYALKLFGICLIIDVAWLGIQAALGQSTINEVVKQFIFTLLFAGICLAIITHYQAWTANIIDGLKAIAGDISGHDLNLTPFRVGIDLTKKILNEISGWSPVDSLGYFIAACVIMGCFALMTARIVLIKCEAYIVMNAAVLLLGFGGSSYLREYAINTVRYALAVAFKLFVMQLVLGIGLSFIENFTLASAEYIDIIVLIATAIILLAIMAVLPESCAGIINGSHTTSGIGVRAATAAVGGAIGAAIGSAAVGGRSANTTIMAAKAAKLEGNNGWSRAAATVKALYGSNAQARREKNSWGSVGQRQNSILKDRVDAANLQAQTMVPPGPSATEQPPTDSNNS